MLIRLGIDPGPRSADVSGTAGSQADFATVVLLGAIFVSLVSRLIPSQTLLKALLLMVVLCGFWASTAVQPDEKKSILELLCIMDSSCLPQTMLFFLS